MSSAQQTTHCIGTCGSMEDRENQNILVATKAKWAPHAKKTEQRTPRNRENQRMTKLDKTHKTQAHATAGGAEDIWFGDCEEEHRD